MVVELGESKVITLLRTVDLVRMTNMGGSAVTAGQLVAKSG